MQWEESGNTAQSITCRQRKQRKKADHVRRSFECAGQEKSVLPLIPAAWSGPELSIALVLFRANAYGVAIAMAFWGFSEPLKSRFALNAPTTWQRKKAAGADSSVLRSIRGSDSGQSSQTCF
jgi:hypothetical protein